MRASRVPWTRRGCASCRWERKTGCATAPSPTAARRAGRLVYLGVVLLLRRADGAAPGLGGPPSSGGLGEENGPPRASPRGSSDRVRRTPGPNRRLLADFSLWEDGSERDSVRVGPERPAAGPCLVYLLGQGPAARRRGRRRAAAAHVDRRRGPRATRCGAVPAAEQGSRGAIRDGPVARDGPPSLAGIAGRHHALLREGRRRVLAGLVTGQASSTAGTCGCA